MAGTAGVDGMVSNATTGAAAGSVAGPWGAVVGAGLGLGGALLSKKRKNPGIDIGPLQASLEAARQRQTGIATALPGQLKPLNGTFQNGVGDAVSTAEDTRRNLASNFLSEMGKSQDLQGKELSDTLKQRVLGAQPEIQAGLRENLAATGGLERGAANTAFADQSTKATQDIASGERDIALAQQQQRADALSKIYSMDEGFVQEKLGISKDVLTQIYNSGRQDLIDEANQLLGIDQTSTAANLSLQEFGGSQGLASNIAGNQNRQNFSNSLINAGGLVAGSYVGRK